MSRSALFKIMLGLTSGGIILYLIYANRIFLFVPLAISLLALLLPEVLIRIFNIIASGGKILTTMFLFVLSSVVFWLMVTPIGLMQKLLHKNQILNARNGSAGNFITTQITYDKKDFKYTF